MTQLLVIREQMRRFYSKFDVYIVPLMKFLLSFTILSIINQKIGYMQRLDSLLIVLVLALLCSFMPMNTMVVLAALLTIAHLYELSLECMLVVGALFLVMFLLYFRFSPKDTFAVLMTPICFILKVPYVIPLVMGLVGSPTSVVSVGCGVVVYYVLTYIAGSATAIASLGAENALGKIRYCIDGIMNNKTMLVAVGAFAVTIIIVWLIRRLNVNHAWTIAIVTGLLTNIVVLLAGDLIFVTNISIGGTILGSLVALVIAKILEFFVFNVDYTRTEYVQFEDDEYYYYVKAVPKNTVSTPEKKVKKISNSNKAADALPAEVEAEVRKIMEEDAKQNP